MSLFKWLQAGGTANASSDSSINWLEGQAPSSVNDSARGMMSAIAKWRDDIGGTLVTAGTSTAYTIATTNQNFAGLASPPPDGTRITFLAHVSNLINATLSINGGGAYSLVTAQNVTAPTGSIVANSIYTVTFRSISSQWFLNDVYNLPIPSNTITLAMMQANSVDASKIVDGSVGTAELGANVVTQAKMGVGSVGTNELINLNVTAAKIANNTITATQIANGTITSTQIAPGTLAPDLTAFIVPVGTVMPYAGGGDPSAQFLSCDGRSLLRASYPTLFGVFGGTPLYGAVDGTHFNLPDLRGRVVAMVDATGTRLTGSTMTPSGNSLGATGGLESRAQLGTEVGSHSHTATSTDSGHTHPVKRSNAQSGSLTGITYMDGTGAAGTGNTDSGTANITTTVAASPAAAAMPLVQPTILLNYIIRVL